MHHPIAPQIALPSKPNPTATPEVDTDAITLDFAEFLADSADHTASALEESVIVRREENGAAKEEMSAAVVDSEDPNIEQEDPTLLGEVQSEMEVELAQEPPILPHLVPRSDPIPDVKQAIPDQPLLNARTVVLDRQEAAVTINTQSRPVPPINPAENKPPTRELMQSVLPVSLNISGKVKSFDGGPLQLEPRTAAGPVPTQPQLTHIAPIPGLAKPFGDNQNGQGRGRNTGETAPIVPADSVRKPVHAPPHEQLVRTQSITTVSVPDQNNVPVISSAAVLKQTNLVHTEAEIEITLPSTATGARGPAEIQPTVTTPFAQSNAAAMARSAGEQMAVSILQNGGGSTEILLSPEELGKVRMVVTAQDTAITLTIQAERPETHDLLRRQIETLAQEFRNMGFGSINFAFQDGQGGPTQDATPQDTSDGQMSDPEISPASTSVQVQSTGLDLRL